MISTLSFSASLPFLPFPSYSQIISNNYHYPKNYVPHFVVNEKNNVK